MNMIKQLIQMRESSMGIGCTMGAYTCSHCDGEPAATKYECIQRKCEVMSTQTHPIAVVIKAHVAKRS